MNILNELLILSESGSKKNLIGLIINGKKVTDKTPAEKWEGNFHCNNIGLASLKGSPFEVGGCFDCDYSEFNSLEHAPSKVGGYFSCNNTHLTSLEHAPSEVGGHFSCQRNKLTSLKGIHKILKKMNGSFYATGNPIKSHVLGLLLIPGCKTVKLDNIQVEDILNKYLPNTRGNRGLIECQSELLDANLEDYAEL